MRRRIPCLSTVDNLALIPEMFGLDESNLTRPTSPVSPTSRVSNCIRYEYCFRRNLIYYAVILLSPTIVVTVLVLVLLITSPPVNVKLPAMMAAVTICCVMAQFCCTLAPRKTLPVIGKKSISTEYCATVWFRIVSGMVLCIFTATK